MHGTSDFGLGFFGFILAILFIVLAVFALLMPFFVYSIKNNIKEMNRKMSVMIELLGEHKIIR
jgi:cell division protein FtsL